MRFSSLPLALGALCLCAGASRAASGKIKISFTPEQAQIIGEFSAEIAKIPRDLYGDPGKLQAYIKTSPDLHQLEPDKKFQNAIAILAGIGGGKRAQRGPAGAGGARLEEDYYRLLARSIPDQPWVFVETGKRAYGRRDYASAFHDYERALRLDPADAEAMLGYGHAANELGDYALAAAAARRLLQSDPGSKGALGLYHFAKDRVSAVRLASDIFPADSSASAAADAAPRAAPPSAAAVPEGTGAAERSAQMAREAAAALRMRDYSSAHELAGKAIALNAGNAQAFNFRAIALNRMSRFAEALVDADAALRLAPGSAAALQTRSWAFAKQGRYQEALRDAEETLVRDASNAFAYQNKALALAGLRDRSGALEALRRSAALDERFQNRYERALQLPQDGDLTLLFDEESGAAEPAPSAPLRKRFARLAALSALGGVLIAVGILHIVSAGWREKVRVTIRRILERAPAQGAGGAAEPVDSAFWAQYQLVKEIGLGGMGVVYEARDRSLERRVAVKKMRDEVRVDPHERSRFINEARMVARLHHPNIVDIYAISEDGEDVYLVFEFVDGRTLQDQIRSDGPVNVASARGVLRAVAEAVEHAHAHQIIHRDLKPSNIMITPDGRVKVMDFGVARLAKDAITKMSVTNTVAGTPPYMAPEQEQGAVCPESDVYALGVCFYEMLTGYLPFNGAGAAMLLNKLNGRHVPITQRNADLPPALDAVIAKALTPDPARRYHTPTQFVAALDAALVVR